MQATSQARLPRRPGLLPGGSWPDRGCRPVAASAGQLPLLQAIADRVGAFQAARCSAGMQASAGRTEIGLAFWIGLLRRALEAALQLRRESAPAYEIEPPANESKKQHPLDQSMASR
jgi:hypothetical protein